MGRMSAVVAVCVAGVFGLTVLAQEKAPDSDEQLMKDINTAGQNLKKNIEAKNAAASVADAAAMKAAFAEVETFWTRKKVEGAIASAKVARRAAADAEAAARNSDLAGLAAAYKTVGGTCKTCHDAHRIKQADGTSLLK